MAEPKVNKKLILEYLLDETCDGEQIQASLAKRKKEIASMVDKAVLEVITSAGFQKQLRKEIQEMIWDDPFNFLDHAKVYDKAVACVAKRVVVK